MELPETVEVESGASPEGSVIWLHGLGADGHDFEAIVPELGLSRKLSLRFVFPHAPMRPVTVNGGMTMRAWYDVLTLERGGPQDEVGIRESGRLLEMLIEREHEREIPYEKIVLAGFSQGGAIASQTALRYPHRLAGLMALSTYLPLQDSFEREVSGSCCPYSRSACCSHRIYSQLKLKFESPLAVPPGSKRRSQKSTRPSFANNKTVEQRVP
jgi:phospholipase/carboxylesterase